MPRANELQERSVPWPSNKSMTIGRARDIAQIWAKHNYVHDVSVQFKTFDDADGVTKTRRNNFYNISTAILENPQFTQTRFHVATISLGCAGAVWGTCKKGPETALAHRVRAIYASLGTDSNLDVWGPKTILAHCARVIVFLQVKTQI